MKTSERLYGNLDKDTARIQKALFLRKKDKAFLLLEKLKPDFNLMDFTKKQRELEYRIDDIKKAIEFAAGQIEEADEVLNAN